jgi:hypothetical protein
MEASVAGTGQGDGGQDGGAEAQPQYVTSDQFDSFVQSQQEMQEMLRNAQFSNQQQQQQTQPTQEAEPEAAPELDLSFLEDAGYDSQDTAERLMGAFGQQIEQATKPLIQRLEQQDQMIREQRYERDAEALVAELPELAKPEVQQQVLGLASELIQTNNWSEDLLHDPKFWRVAYFAAKAADTANSEGSEQPNAAHLEGGGGATPASAQVDPAQLIAEQPREGRAAFPWL